MFCVFEACVGMYFPAMGYQKGKVVDDGNRAHIYGLLRIPFNIFVVVGLSLTREGEVSPFHSSQSMDSNADEQNRRRISRNHLHDLQWTASCCLCGRRAFPPRLNICTQAVPIASPARAGRSTSLSIEVSSAQCGKRRDTQRNIHSQPAVLDLMPHTRSHTRAKTL